MQTLLVSLLSILTWTAFMNIIWYALPDSKKFRTILQTLNINYEFTNDNSYCDRKALYIMDERLKNLIIYFNKKGKLVKMKP